jgi:hypothetical protein
MAAKIDFRHFNPTEKVCFVVNQTSSDESHSREAAVHNRSPEIHYETVNLLLKISHGKLLYSFNETAKILRVSSQFIRGRCKLGAIKTIYLGDRPMITINEIAKIIIEGV